MQSCEETRRVWVTVSVTPVWLGQQDGYRAEKPGKVGRGLSVGAFACHVKTWGILAENSRKGLAK